MKRNILKHKSSPVIILLLAVLCYGCQSSMVTQKEEPTLKKIFEDDFYIGAALSGSQINAEDSATTHVIETEFNSITPENVMKWMYIHPEPDSFYFEMSDRFVELGHKNGMNVVGHALVWHSQIAEYMNEVSDSLTMVDYITSHINVIATRYKGKIDTWDVVNEAFNEDGTYRESNFYKVLGPSYLELAFSLAAAADPNAKLIYNDYNLWKPEKRQGVIRMVKQFREKGIKIDGVGIQGHWSVQGPDIAQVRSCIQDFVDADIEIMYTELDLTTLPNPWELVGAEISQNYEGSPYMNPFTDGLPDTMAVKLGERYQDIFELFVEYKENISRVTFWGVNDKQSWLNNWPIENRTNYPLLFDRASKRKLAYDYVAKVKLSETE